MITKLLIVRKSTILCEVGNSTGSFINVDIRVSKNSSGASSYNPYTINSIIITSS